MDHHPVNKPNHDHRHCVSAHRRVGITCFIQARTSVEVSMEGVDNVIRHREGSAAVAALELSDRFKEDTEGLVRHGLESVVWVE